ncbi:MAG: dephospho-CoA kinase [Rhodospirillaceae bacterium]|nr:dephospho-CoA kinase [Rhodospirillaceae bacterium]
MKIVGLTGSIGMGKSTAAKMMKTMGVPVFDADETVHHLLSASGQAFEAITRRFPEAVGPDGVDRQTLGKMVFGDTTALTDLENILHPLVRGVRKTFLRTHALRRTRCVTMDVPLLFETGAEKSCDVVVVVTAPLFLQRQRVLSRTGMTREKLKSILARQLPDRDKRRHASTLVSSGLGKRHTWVGLKHFLSNRFQ